MHIINSTKDINECLDILERSIIESNIFNMAAIGYLGKVDRLFKSFWIVDHMNMYQKRSGYKFYSYRRFEASIYKTFDGSTVEGEFKMIPLYKISFIIYFSLLILLNVFILILAKNLMGSLKVLGLSLVFAALAILIIKFNVNRSKKYEDELIDFIDVILNRSD